MTDAAEAASSVIPSATPSEAEVAAWQALSRDEQLRRLQARLTHPNCSTASDATMKDIFGRAQAVAKQRRD